MDPPRKGFPVEQCGTDGPRFLVREPVDPPADWLMAWASGWMAGHATGYEHGHEDGQQQYAGTLADALRPMRRAAAHGIDVAIARGAWEQHRRRMGGDET